MSTPSCCSLFRVALTTGSPPRLCCFLLDWEDWEDWEGWEDWEDWEGWGDWEGWEDWEESESTDRLLLLDSSSTSCLLCDSCSRLLS